MLGHFKIFFIIIKNNLCQGFVWYWSVIFCNYMQKKVQSNLNMVLDVCISVCVFAFVLRCGLRVVCVFPPSMMCWCITHSVVVWFLHCNWHFWQILQHKSVFLVSHWCLWVMFGGGGCGGVGIYICVCVCTTGSVPHCGRVERLPFHFCLFCGLHCVTA